MAHPGTQAVAVVLTNDERETLERWACRPKSAQALALRCRIVLACAEGGTDVAVAQRLGISRGTVGKWRRRFIDSRLDGLHDEPRPGAPRTVTDYDVERVIVKTLEETPPNATHWSTRSLATATGMSQSAVSRIWRAFAFEAASGGVVQVVARSAVHRQGPRHRWVVSQPSRRRGRVLRRREDPDPSVGSHPLRCSRCCRARRSAGPTTTYATGRRTCTRRWTSHRAT